MSCGGRDEERRLTEKAGAITREDDVKTIPRDASVAEGGETCKTAWSSDGAQNQYAGLARIAARFGFAFFLSTYITVSSSIPSVTQIDHWVT